MSDDHARARGPSLPTGGEECVLVSLPSLVLDRYRQQARAWGIPARILIAHAVTEQSDRIRPVRWLLPLDAQPTRRARTSSTQT